MTPIWIATLCIMAQLASARPGLGEEHCPRGQVFSPCASTCGVATCQTLETPCPDRACVPGCVCPDPGQVWHRGRCVDDAVCYLRPIPTICPRGQVFSECASPCKVPTCQTFGISCPEKRCEPGCMCPLETPVWHKGRCVAPQECREDEEEEGGECPKGLEYSSCASACGIPTCETYFLHCIAVCKPGCVCPNRRHVWYRNRCQDPHIVCWRGNPGEMIP